MDELVYLRSRIPAYADYGDEDSRHLVDKQVRAYVGEVLSLVRERLPELPQPHAQRLESTLMLCEFTDQQVMKVLDHLLVSDAEADLLHEVDHELIQLADEGRKIEAAAVDDFLDRIEKLFARRSKAVLAPI